MTALDDAWARGRAARARTPRSSHAQLDAGERPDPIDLLEEQAKTRVPDLVGVRYARMASSPFAFFRGAARVMTADLAGSPTSGLWAQLCGDAHLGNFGLFASPERQLVFDINDFDETAPGPWEWDVKRLATSLEVAGRESGFEDAVRQRMVLEALAEYRQVMRWLATKTNLDVWYAYLPVEQLFFRARSAMDRVSMRFARDAMVKARSRDHLQAAAKLVSFHDGELRFVSDPPLLVPVEETVEAGDAGRVPVRVRQAMESYRASLSEDRRRLLDQFSLVHVAHKVVGIGSVGLRAWVLLLRGPTPEDVMILQFKEAQTSVVEEYTVPSRYDNAGHRVVAGQRMMQAASDILLGWQRTPGFDDVPRDFYVRQLRDWKSSVEIDQMTPQVMTIYGQMAAWTLARAHARTGDRFAIAAYLGTKPAFDRAVAEFAVGYADRNEGDHAALVRAIRDGRVPGECD